MKDSALNVMIPKDLKNLVKIEAIRSGLTIRAYVIKALKERIEKDETDSRDS